MFVVWGPCGTDAALCTHTYLPTHTTHTRITALCCAHREVSRFYVLTREGAFLY